MPGILILLLVWVYQRNKPRICLGGTTIYIYIYTEHALLVCKKRDSGSENGNPASMAWMHTPIFSSTCAGEETACVERRQASRQTKDATRRFDWFDPFRRFESNFLRFAFRFPRLPDSVGFVAPALWRWWPLTGTRAAPTSRSGRSRSAPSSRRWEADRKSASVQTLVIDKHGNSKRHIETLGCIAISSSIQQRPMQPVKQSLLLHLNQKMPNERCQFLPMLPEQRADQLQGKTS